MLPVQGDGATRLAEEERGGNAGGQERGNRLGPA